MKNFRIVHGILPITFFLTFTPVALSAGDSQAADFIVFSESYDTDCEDKGGQRVFVRNQHATRLIDLHLDRYFSGLRQGGRSMFALAPGASQALGCSRVFDARQNWKLVHAEFISADDAESRYGEVSGRVSDD